MTSSGHTASRGQSHGLHTHTKPSTFVDLHSLWGDQLRDMMKQGGSQASRSSKFRKGGRATQRPGEKRAKCRARQGGDGDVAGPWIYLCGLWNVTERVTSKQCFEEGQLVKLSWGQGSSKGQQRLIDTQWMPRIAALIRTTQGALLVLEEGQGCLTLG